MKKRIALRQSTDADWDLAPYDVYELDSDLPFGSDLHYDFDELTWVGTVGSYDELPDGARRINEDEPANSDYSAWYELPAEAPVVAVATGPEDHPARPYVVFDDRTDPTNAGWVLRHRDNGQDVDTILDATDPDAASQAVSEATALVAR